MSICRKFLSEHINRLSFQNSCFYSCICYVLLRKMYDFELVSKKIGQLAQFFCINIPWILNTTIGSLFSVCVFIWLQADIRYSSEGEEWGQALNAHTVKKSNDYLVWVYECRQGNSKSQERVENSKICGTTTRLQPREWAMEI